MTKRWSKAEPYHKRGRASCNQASGKTNPAKAMKMGIQQVKDNRRGHPG